MTEAERATHDEAQRVRRTLLIDEPRQPLSDRERFLIGHVTMFGSDGYPIQKLGRRWSAEPFPTLFKTRREAEGAFERYLETLHDRLWVERYDAMVASGDITATEGFSHERDH